MKNPIIMAFAREMLQMTDEDMAKVTPQQEEEFQNALENMGKYRLVAEVDKSKYCTAGLKTGQKIIVTGSLIDKEASDCPLCPGMIAPLSASVQVYIDRCSRNRDLAAPMSAITCIDPGLDAGGLGNVTMKVRIESLP